MVVVGSVVVVGVMVEVEASVVGQVGGGDQGAQSVVSSIQQTEPSREELHRRATTSNLSIWLTSSCVVVAIVFILRILFHLESFQKETQIRRHRSGRRILHSNLAATRISPASLKVQVSPTDCPVPTSAASPLIPDSRYHQAAPQTHIGDPSHQFSIELPTHERQGLTSPPVVFVQNDTDLFSPSEAPTSGVSSTREATPTTAHKQDETTTRTITSSGAHLLLPPPPPSLSKSVAPRAVDGAAAAREVVKEALLVDRLAATAAAAGSADSAKHAPIRDRQQQWQAARHRHPTRVIVVFDLVHFFSELSCSFVGRKRLHQK